MKFRIFSPVLLNVLRACDSTALKAATRPMLMATVMSVRASEDGKSGICRFLSCDSSIAFTETVEWRKYDSDKGDFVAVSGKCQFEGKRVIALLKAHQFINKIPQEITIMDTEDKVSFWLGDDFFAVPKIAGEYPLDTDDPYKMAEKRELCIPVAFSIRILRQTIDAAAMCGNDGVITLYIPKENDQNHLHANQASIAVDQRGGKEAAIIMTQMRFRKDY